MSAALPLLTSPNPPDRVEVAGEASDASQGPLATSARVARRRCPAGHWLDSGDWCGRCSGPRQLIMPIVPAQLTLAYPLARGTLDTGGDTLADGRVSGGTGRRGRRR